MVFPNGLICFPGQTVRLHMSVSQSVSFNHLLSKGCRDPNNEARVREYQWLMKHTRAGDKRAHDYCASFKTSYHPSETLWVRAQKTHHQLTSDTKRTPSIGIKNRTTLLAEAGRGTIRL